MKNKLKWIMSAVLFFSAVPTVSAMDLSNQAGMEEVKKKKWKKKKNKSSNKNRGKKSKKGFWSFFGGG